MLAFVVGGGLVGFAAGGVAPMALHLHLAGPAEQEEVAEGSKAVVADADVQASLHEVGQGPPQQGPARVVVDVGDHGFAVAVVEADGVVVVVVEEGALPALHEGVVFLPLPMGEGADEVAFVVEQQGFLAEPGGGLAIDRDRSIVGGGLDLHLLPSAGAYGIEGLHDVA